MPDDDRPYSLFVRPRPRRIAFLLDPDTVQPELLDKIAKFCIDCWGGRYFPIVPTRDGEVLADYWQLLRIADPDVILCYSETNPETIERLEWEIGPLAIEERWKASQIPGAKILVHGQVTVRQMLVGLRDLYPAHFRRVEPSVLAFDFGKGEEQSASSFVKRNFGVSFEAYFCAFNLGIPGKFPVSASDGDVLDCVSATENLALPIDVCARALRRQRARTVSNADVDEFVIYFVSSAWNFIQFWNVAQFADRQPWPPQMDQLWVPENVIQDSSALDRLVRVIRRRAYWGKQRRISMISSDHDEPEMLEILKQLCSECKSHFFPGATVKITKEYFPKCHSASVSVGFRGLTPQHEHLRGRLAYIEPQQPDCVGPDPSEAWMADLNIEDPYHERYADYSWWKLPKNDWLGQLFSGRRPSRIGCRGEVSFQIGAQERVVEVRQPTDLEVFSGLLLPEVCYTAGDLRKQKPAHHCVLQISDKGKYLQGVIDLFGSLRSAGRFMEHRFWRDLLLKLCVPRTPEHVKSKVRKRIATFVQAYAADKDAARDWLVEKVLDAGRGIPRADSPITYEGITKLYDAFLSGLDDEQKQLEEISGLKDEMSELTRRGVLLQGAKLRCKACLSSFWYHVDDLRSRVTCTGCRSDILLPAETVWYYQPNELLRNGMRDHGTMPVIRTLVRLFDHADGFLFLPSVKLYDYQSETDVAEIDIAWVKNGEYGIAEVKSTTDAFSGDDMKRLTEIAIRTRPQRVLLAAPEGDDKRLEKHRQVLLSNLSGLRVDAWGPATFASEHFPI